VISECLAETSSMLPAFARNAAPTGHPSGDAKSSRGAESIVPDFLQPVQKVWSKLV